MSHSALIDLSHISVLCVDDDPVIRSVVRFALQGHGCQDVVQAHGALDALDLCAGRSFDLLISDFQMSPMTGLEMLRQMAESGIAQDWPVIMLSAESNPATIQEAHALGVSAWVGKPVSAQTLVEQVGKVLRQRGRISNAAPDRELLAMVERRQAHLMAALRNAEDKVQSINLRPREAARIAHGLHQSMDDLSEHTRALDYGLATMLAGRAMMLAEAMENDPAGAARGHVSASRVLATVITAMKRVAQNRMTGDGAEAGLTLLGKIDDIIAPVRAGLS